MELDFLLENENFKVDEECSKDLEAALIVNSRCYTLEESFEKLSELKPNCSDLIKKGIEQYIEAKKTSLEIIRSMLNEGYVLFPKTDKYQPMPNAEVFTSIEDFLEFGSNSSNILIKVGKPSFYTFSHGSASITKNDDNKLMNVHVSDKLMPEDMQLDDNDLLNRKIRLSHKFKRFDIVEFPVTHTFGVVVDKSDISNDAIVVDKGSFEIDLYLCRLRNDLDPNSTFYFQHFQNVPSVHGLVNKIEYDDAPITVKKLVDTLKTKSLIK